MRIEIVVNVADGKYHVVDNAAKKTLGIFDRYEDAAELLDERTKRLLKLKTKTE